MKKLNNPITIKSRLLAEIDKTLGRLQRAEVQVRTLWNKNYQRFLKATEFLANARNNKTKAFARAAEIVRQWRLQSENLTKRRDQYRDDINLWQDKKKQVEVELSVLHAQLESQIRETDGIVDQVFALNDSVVQALESRDAYVSNHVYNRLFDDKGHLRSQVTIDSADGLRRVVAMVNTITKIEPVLAAEALRLIESFFAKYQQQSEVDAVIRSWIEITSALLIEKVSFKVGPNLYRFLGVDIDSDLLPELAQAQMLLRKSLRSEKTNTYLRLYCRTSRVDRWMPVRVS